MLLANLNSTHTTKHAANDALTETFRGRHLNPKPDIESVKHVADMGSGKLHVVCVLCIHSFANCSGSVVIHVVEDVQNNMLGRKQAIATTGRDEAN